MILGISGSPRSNGITANAVKKILAGCTKDNKCIVQDDFPAIAEEMVQADAIIFGIPNYYDVPNELSHCLLERCFCFRHQSAFLLQGKPAVVLSTGYSSDEENSPVLRIVEKFMVNNKVNTVSKFLVAAYSQCYTCNFGRTCVDGNIVKNNGLVEEVTPDMLPAKFDKQPESIVKCENAGKLLNEMVL